LPELERIMGLRVQINPDDLEACPVVAHRRAAGATE
jgi:hypothetical protein